MNTVPPNVRVGATASVVISVVVLSFVAYLPSVNNEFISDDFTMLPFLRLISEHPGGILEMPSEIFRVVSYVYFWGCLQLFGTSSAAFYLTGIGLHALISLLVGKLVLALTRQPGAAFVAALFFAVYERHQEAVMWISAVNDALLTLFCVLFLLFWIHALEKPERPWTYRLALTTLFIAMFSKEASVALVPLAIFLLVLKRRPRREILQWAIPPVLMLCGYVALWLWEANRNFFVVDGHYALGFHFVPVYLKSFWRIVSPSLLFLVPLLWVVRGQAKSSRDVSTFLDRGAVLFFFSALSLTIVPYSFLTYLDHIPSRNTYLPSVGLAALMGILFVALHERLATGRGRRVCTTFLVLILAGNVVYLWLKKEPQFQERAAPTRELLANLNGSGFEAVGSAPIHVCGFPLHVSIGRAAVEGFTPFGPGRVAFLEQCDGEHTMHALEWTPGAETYARRIVSADSESDHETEKKGGL